jgi:hypothetical protein
VISIFLPISLNRLKSISKKAKPKEWVELEGLAEPEPMQIGKEDGQQPLLTIPLNPAPNPPDLIVVFTLRTVLKELFEKTY